MTLRPTRFEVGRPMLLGGLRRRHDFAESVAGIAEQWRAFPELEEGIPGRIGAHRYGVLCGSDPAGFEYMCGVEVEALDVLPSGVGRMRVLEQRYAIFLHSGTGATLHRTWMQAFSWLESSPFDSAHKPDFEVYEPDYDPTVVSEVEIWMAVVEAGGK